MNNRGLNTPKIIKGIGVSDGIAFGNVFILEREKIAVPHRLLDDDMIEHEIERFNVALEKAKLGLARIKEGLIKADSHEPAFIIDAHMMILEDEMLVDRTVGLIRERRLNAEWALRTRIEDLVSIFDKMEDPYLRERGHDVEEVGERVIRELVGRTDNPLAQIDEPVIVVAHDLAPAETAHMAGDKVLAFATDIGSATSHTAIVAKSLRIPAVVGLKTATKLINHGDKILIDGHAGIVIVNPAPDTVEEYESRRKWLEELREALKSFKDLPSKTKDGHEIKLGANLEIVEEAKYLRESGAQGVGLFRTEYLYLDRDDLPSEEEHFESYKRLVEATAPHGVTIRTFDLGGDKFKSSLSVSDELNPAMGLRAIRLSLHRPDLFKTQLRAILRASALGKARVMFPMISGYKEFIDARKHLSEAARELESAGVSFDKDIEVGIMIEVPSAAIVASDLAEVSDFFSIGTNDLIQYTLAIDRINENVSHLYQPLHPAVLRIIRSVVQAGHDKGIPVHMCGAMAANPLHLPVLIGLGLDELGMPMGMVLRIKRILRGIKKEEAGALVEELFKYNTAQEIEQRVKEEIMTRWAEAYALEREAFEEERLAPVT